MTLSPGTKLGPYEVIGPLGAGGMGEVYRARDSRLGRDVAVKVLPSSLSKDPEALSRFDREARSVAALSHPNILDIHDFGSEGGISYAVTELLEGETLRERLALGPLAWRKASEIGVAIAEGLSAAHAKGIVHRDLKPENVFVTSDGRVKILDFGLARDVAVPAAFGASSAPTTPGTEAGTLLGTIGYMSPEQIRGQPADARSDIFSLGCVLHEMISGRRAFAGETGAETMTAILREDPPPLSQPGRPVPAELERVVARCLEKSPGERLQSSRDLASRLTDILALTPTPGARDMGPRTRWGRPALAAVAALAVIGAVFLLSRGWGHGRGIDSLAVLPFVNASGDPGAEYLSDGITETLINRLSQIPDLRVVPRATAFQYKGQKIDLLRAGRALKVRAVLTGRITRVGDALNVQTDLVDVERESQLWGEQYNRPASDILAVQEAIASEIAARLKIRLTGAQEEQLTRSDTTDTEAYQLYLKGRYHWNRRTTENLDKAVSYFEQAIARDPGYARAHAGLADCYAVMQQYTGRLSTATAPKAIAAARRALELDGRLAEPHATLGWIYGFYEWDHPAAERELRRAIDLDPTYPTARHWYGLFLASFQGRFDEALAQLGKGMELDPVSLIIQSARARVFYLAGRYDEAIAASRKTIDLDPSFGNPYWTLGIAHLAKKEYAPALVALEKGALVSRRGIESIGDLGHAYAVMGRKREALSIVEELNRFVREGLDGYVNVALVYSGLGESDLALRALDGAVVAHSSNLRHLKFDPRFGPLKADPRYGELLRKIGVGD